MADKKLFVDASRAHGILTFENITGMLHVNYHKLTVTPARQTASGEIELRNIPFIIMREEPCNAQLFIDEASKSMWVVPSDEWIFGMNVTIVKSNFDFESKLFNGTVSVKHMPYQHTVQSQNFLKEMAEIQASEDLEEDKDTKEVLVNKVEDGSNMDVEALVGALEELAIDNRWIGDNTPLPVPDDTLFNILNKHNEEIVSYFEDVAKINGIIAVAKMIGYLNKDLALVKEIVTKKEIAHAQNSLPKQFKRVIQLKQIKSGCILAIKLDDGIIVPFDLKDMPILAFGNRRAGNHAFAALKAHPVYSKFFVSQADIIDIDELDDESLELSAVLIKNAVPFLEWMGREYGKAGKK